MEQELISRERRYRTLLESVPDFIVHYDSDLRRIYVNPAWEKASGLPAREVIGVDYTAISRVPRPAADEYIRKLRLPMYGGLSALRHVLKVCPDVPFIFLSGTIGEDAAIEALTKGATDYVLKQNLKRLGSAVKRALEDARNRRDRKQAEAALAMSEAMMRTILDSVDEGFIVIDRDYRILSVNKAFCSLVNLREDQVIGVRCHEISHNSARPCFSSGEDCPVKGTFETGRSHTAIHTHKDASGAHLYIDPAQIDQILANLCVNARDAITGVGRITIETDMSTFDSAYCASYPECIPGEYVSLTVRDDGCGMGSETLSKIFEPFFTTKEIGRGTGLGLATVYGIVTQNSGFIRVYSVPGQGTTFKLYLPRHKGENLEAPKKDEAAPTPGGHETVLLVEDEHSILNMAKMMLEKFGYRVLCASTPGEAIRLTDMHDGDIHLLIVDVIMPEMNGRELAKQIVVLYPEIVCLFMSGYSGDVIAHHGMLDEGVNFIQKPFSMQDLVAKVRQILDTDT